MNTEEKAKAYDEALKLAKNWIKDGSESSTKKCLELLFPELRESEDEMHRRWILEYLYDGLRKADEQLKVHFKAAIAYLEKQKEQKPAEWSEEDEKKLEDLTSLLAILEGCSTVNVGTSAKYCFWLNSLRSRLKSSGNWKPSDEQMIALYNMIPFVKSVGGPSEAVKPLESLYEDLKKL